MPTSPAQQAHYKKNRERYIRQSREQRIWFRLFVDWLKSVPCADCNVQYSPWVMQFDHTGSDKVAPIAKIMIRKNIYALLDEVRKCEVVCANCHAERTHNRAVVA